jgi:SAM-dependent methyltransferase
MIRQQPKHASATSGLSSMYDRMEGIAEQRYAPMENSALVSSERSDWIGSRRGHRQEHALLPARGNITAIDLTPGMLEHAQKRATALGLKVYLQLGDVQALSFPDGSFDAAVATFVFLLCSQSGLRLGRAGACRETSQTGVPSCLYSSKSIWMRFLHLTGACSET